jgi:hypothetical protein
VTVLLPFSVRVPEMSFQVPVNWLVDVVGSGSFFVVQAERLITARMKMICDFILKSLYRWRLVIGFKVVFIFLTGKFYS